MHSRRRTSHLPFAAMLRQDGLVCDLHDSYVYLTIIRDTGRSANKVRHTTATTCTSLPAACPLTGRKSAVPDLVQLTDHPLSLYCSQPLLTDPPHLKAPPQPQTHPTPCQRTVLDLVLQLQTQAEPLGPARQPQKLKLDLQAYMLQCYLAQLDPQWCLSRPQHA